MKSILRALLVPAALSLSLVSFAFADDSKHVDSKATSETTHDVSKNPLTGNTTETTSTESQMKVGDATKKSKHVRKRKFNKEGTKVKEENDSKTEMHH